MIRQGNESSALYATAPPYCINNEGVRCLIPRFDGVILSREWKDALWDKFVMEAPRPRTLSELQ
ncbi:hypothetical protein EG244_20120 [Falsigemmobacter faecalis]|uniref:Uncharacterized protein n=1 Tax=Falsigemmobacter faecalis TaxID=2488730 RepID=A0A3P3D1N9_9RHOB|nr:hypothetical protein EG244_20120 [Falsigemmobacter faecalis]